MSAIAKTMLARISPKKSRLAAGLIRGLQVEEALSQLRLTPMKGCRLLERTLKSAIANAEIKLDAKRENLFVKEVRIDAGPSLKRSKSKARGGSVPILKRSSHFTIVVEKREGK